MLNRRLIRIKVFKVLFSSVSSGSESIEASEKELLHSCEKSLDLYYFILSLLYAIRRVAVNKIETGLKKFYPTEEEANPSTKFIDNRFFKMIEDDPILLKKCESKGLIWADDDLFVVRKIFNSIIESDYYKNYIVSGDSSDEEDFKIITDILIEELEDSEDLYSVMEERSLFWIDDLGYVLNVLIKNVEQMRNKKSFIHPSVFLKEEDKEYALQLLHKSIIKYDEMFDLVSRSTENWDSDRLVSTDIVLIIMGLTEAIEFPSIPVKVTINEYVEIAKFYSTPNSKLFVNGLLDKLIQKLLSEGAIVKTGRGLLDS